MWSSGCGYLSESLEVEDQYVWQCPECDLLCGVLLLVFAVWTVPRVLSVQLSVRVGGRGREGEKVKQPCQLLGTSKQDELVSMQKQTGKSRAPQPFFLIPSFI